MLSLAAAVERLSEHPLSAAVVEKAEEAGASSARRGLRRCPAGVQARAAGRTVLIGSRDLMEERGTIQQASETCWMDCPIGQDAAHLCRRQQTARNTDRGRYAQAREPDVIAPSCMGLQVILLTGTTRAPRRRSGASWASTGSSRRDARRRQT